MGMSNHHWRPPLVMEDFQFDQGRLVYIRGKRPQYIDGYALIAAMEQFAVIMQGYKTLYDMVPLRIKQHIAEHLRGRDGIRHNDIGPELVQIATYAVTGTPTLAELERRHRPGFSEPSPPELWPQTQMLGSVPNEVVASFREQHLTDPPIPSISVVVSTDDIDKKVLDTLEAKQSIIDNLSTDADPGGDSSGGE